MIWKWAVVSSKCKASDEVEVTTACLVDGLVSEQSELTCTSGSRVEARRDPCFRLTVFVKLKLSVSL